MIYAFLALLLAFWLAITFVPALSRSRVRREDARRADLEEERDLLLSQLSGLEGESGAEVPSREGPLEETERERLRLKVQAARVLTELDSLPPALEGPALERSPLPLLLGIGAGVVLLLGVGLFTFLSDWQQDGLRADYAQTLKVSSRLPALEAAARGGGEAALLELGNTYYTLNRLAEASQAYGTLLQQNPKQPQALRRFGLLLAQQPERAAQGLAFVRQSTELAPREAEGFLFLGVLQAQAGDRAAGLSSVRKAQALEPQNTEVQAVLAELEPPREQLASSGERLYAQNCAACHGAQGQGRTGPALTGSAVLRDRATLASVIQKGKGTMQGYPNLRGQDLERLLDFTQGLRK